MLKVILSNNLQSESNIRSPKLKMDEGVQDMIKRTICDENEEAC